MQKENSIPKLLKQQETRAKIWINHEQKLTASSRNKGRWTSDNGNVKVAISMKNFPAASVEKFGSQKSKLLRRKILTNIIETYIIQCQRIFETYFEVKIQNHHVAEKCWRKAENASKRVRSSGNTDARGEMLQQVVKKAKYLVWKSLVTNSLLK